MQFLPSLRCDWVFSGVYTDNPQVAARDRGEACLHTAQPCPPLPLQRVVLPAALYPVLVPSFGVRDPLVDDKGKLRTLD